MKIRRIYAVTLRSLYSSIHSLDKMTDAFYWPMIDLFLWGLTGTYFITTSENPTPILHWIVAAIVLWTVVYRAQYEISGNLLEELWSRNLVNLFVSPLKFSEWLIGFLAVGIIKSIASLAFAGVLALFLYKFQVLILGWRLLGYAGILLMTGWALGFFVTGIILRYGTRIQAIAWTIVWVIAPFAAVYYPMSILPEWGQYVARLIPITYVFEDMRLVIQTGSGNNINLLYGFALNGFYLILSYIFIRRSFSAVLKRGLVKVY
ncbi:MAG: hypothetical protein A3B86_03350 [Candidatus Yanofskybacteria bacterium RIFCSPHIGHO2_02_FULL_38_22b]|uniref:ABC transmembrane type-2 domain-containing protein n=1 Tax=Candidatus Yanofskybacteria bacterium RIFCSPHIGHO2_02_FULL_38_22b TaxID=1802673 RepID=A0A1F8F3W4_9BACT|nr:MAG: hypothetical protein A3B86_03350 [Candidatus Yanofskybacteria bacterium RIFCSPHIGHO2_02_FULL_38_22b]OGN19884.1 MAG: hypothetical protein A2910_01925 [Candidatus Yanofskybacteria bacterium RIFCSPLOWO2_01_FULL_39_28]